MVLTSCILSSFNSFCLRSLEGSRVLTLCLGMSQARLHTCDAASNITPASGVMPPLYLQLCLSLNSPEQNHDQIEIYLKLNFKKIEMFKNINNNKIFRY